MSFQRIEGRVQINEVNALVCDVLAQHLEELIIHGAIECPSGAGCPDHHTKSPACAIRQPEKPLLVDEA
jgi:hypothetical protein